MVTAVAGVFSYVHSTVSEDWVAANGDSVTGLDLDQLLSDLQYVPQG